MVRNTILGRIEVIDRRYKLYMRNDGRVYRLEVRDSDNTTLSSTKVAGMGSTGSARWRRIIDEQMEWFERKKRSVIPPSPEFVVDDVVAPSRVELRNSATVTVTVGNTGDGSGTATVEVSANGSLVGGRSVSLSPGQSRDVEFTWTPASVGTFTLEGRANGSTATASVEVQEAPPPPPGEVCTVPVPVLGDVDCVVAAAGVGGLGLLGLVAGLEG